MVRVTEHRNKVIVTEDRVKVVSVGKQGPQGIQGPPGDLQAGTAGDMLVHGATSWDVLPAGTDGQILASISGSPNWSNALTDHEADTLDVHGVADTAALETQSGAQSKADTAVSDHNAATTVHGVDTTQLATQADVDAVLPDPTVDGDVLTLAAGEPTWAAPEGGGGEALMPLLQTTGAQSWAMPGYNLSESPAGQLMYGTNMVTFPIILDQGYSADYVKIEVSGAGAAGAAVRIGLYAALPSLHPGALLADFGTVAADSTGSKLIALSPTANIPSGYALLAYVPNDSGVWIRAIQSSTLTGNTGPVTTTSAGSTTFPRVKALRFSLTGDPVTDGLPDPAPSPNSTAEDVPWVMLRLVHS